MAPYGFAMPQWVESKRTWIKLEAKKQQCDIFCQNDGIIDENHRRCFCAFHYFRICYVEIDVDIAMV